MWVIRLNIYIILVIAILGCSRNHDIHEIDAARNILKECHLALINKDYNKFKSFLIGDERYLADAVRAIYNQGTAVYDFENALYEIRGKNSVKIFYDIYVCPPFFPKMPPQDPKWNDMIKITINGDKALYTNPITNTKEYLVKINNKWKIPIKLYNYKYTINDFNRIARIIRSGIKLINNKNLSLREIKEKMNSQYWKEVNSEEINQENS